MPPPSGFGRLEPHVEQVVDGIYAFVQPDGGWGLNNPGFVVGSRSTLVIDAATDRRRTQALIDAVTDRSPGPIDVLVNTHMHPDHTAGNCVFGDEVTIVATAETESAMDQFCLPLLARGHSPIFPTVRLDDLVYRAPELTFSGRLTMYVDDLAVELLQMGEAHSADDLVAWIPERRVLFAGDLVFHRGVPLFSSAAGLRTALHNLAALDPDVIVPGHGGVCGPEAVEEALSWLDYVEALAQEGIRTGASPLEVARTADFGPFEGWIEHERIVSNLHQLYARHNGTTFDQSTATAEMIKFNGQPLRCTI